MSSVYQFDNIINDNSTQKYKLERRYLNNNKPYRFGIIAIIILILTVIYFQIQIYFLKKTISSLSEVNPPLQSSTKSNSKQHLLNQEQDQYDYSNLNNSYPNTKLDLRASTIITTSKQIKFIHKLLGSFQDKLKLLYKASYFGDSFESLNNVLFKENNILLLVKTENEEIIGGFSKNAFDRSKQCLFLDYSYTSFTFDVNAEQKQSVYVSWDEFCKGIMTFGYDLILYDNFTSSDENFYDFTPKKRTYQYQHENVNHHHFRVQEMEIYKVVRINQLKEEKS